jgi:predicted RNA-binding protein with PUA-like domain
MSNYWLVKSEPDVFSIDDLQKAPSSTTHWEGVRNYQARNHLRAMKTGDGVIFYHSNAAPTGIAGLAEIAREAYDDKSALDRHSPYFDPSATPADPRWSVVDIRWVRSFTRVLSLDELHKLPALSKMLLLRKGNRLSVTPVTEAEWQAVLAQAEKPAPPPTPKRKNTKSSKSSKPKVAKSKGKSSKSKSKSKSKP